MLAVLGVTVMWIGLVVMLLGGIVFLIAAFRESILWGLGVLFLPFVSLVFLVLHWRAAKDGFFLQLYGLAAALLGIYALGASLPLP